MNGKKRSAISFQQLAVISVLFAVFLIIEMVAINWRGNHTSYYRGVYESCVRAQVVNEQVTQFDLRVCEEMETRARREGWIEEELVRP